METKNENEVTELKEKVDELIFNKWTFFILFRGSRDDRGIQLTSEGNELMLYEAKREHYVMLGRKHN